MENAFQMLVESPPRPRALRCSGLPYCPILDAVVPDEPEQGNLAGALYMGIGTVMHSSLQFFFSLGKPGAGMWGCWECSQCHTKKAHCFRPPDCCGVPMRYEEVSLRVACMTGHVDFLAKYGNRWVVLDFKTTAADPRKPKREHLLQVRHYAALLKIQHNITIDAYYIVYIGRAKPPEEQWIYGPYDAKTSINETTDWIFRAIRGFKAATMVRNGDHSKEALAELVKSRPCHSTDDFDSYMSRRYEFSRKDCPMLQNCIKGNRACYNAVKDIIDT